MERKVPYLKLISNDKKSNVVHLPTKQVKKDVKPVLDDTVMGENFKENSIPLAPQTKYEDCIDLDYFELMVQSEIILQGSLKMVVADREEKDGLYSAINRLGQDSSYKLFMTFLDVEMNELITNVINKECIPNDDVLMLFIDITVEKILRKICDYNK